LSRRLVTAESARKGRGRTEENASMDFKLELIVLPVVDVD